METHVRQQQGLAAQRAGEAGARGDPSTGGSLPTWGNASQHTKTRCWQQGPVTVPAKTRDEPYPGSIHGVQSGAKGDEARGSTGHKLQCTSEQSIQEIRHLPHRPEVHPGGSTTSRTEDRETTSRAQEGTGDLRLSLYGAPEPVGRGCGWGPQLRLIRATGVCRALASRCISGVSDWHSFGHWSAESVPCLLQRDCK